MKLYEGINLFENREFEINLNLLVMQRTHTQRKVRIM